MEPSLILMLLLLSNFTVFTEQTEQTTSEVPSDGTGHPSFDTLRILSMAVLWFIPMPIFFFGYKYIKTKTQSAAKEDIETGPSDERIPEHVYTGLGGSSGGSSDDNMYRTSMEFTTIEMPDENHPVYEGNSMAVIHLEPEMEDISLEDEPTNQIPGKKKHRCGLECWQEIWQGY